MNHIYKTVFNASLGTWVAVSEFAKGKTKNSNVGWAEERSPSFSPNTDMIGFLSQPILPIALLACSNAYALPTGNELVAGQATVSNPTINQMQINQASDRAVINWQGFSVGQNEAVHIQQPHANAALLNRVVGQDASQIQGKIQANGQVYLVNPNGVMFSKTAQVDVGGLVASTHDIKNDDFMAGKNHFTQNGATGKVENHGTINTTDGGVVALIGEQVSNTGTINTPKGTTALAAGKTVDLDMTGDGLVEVKVTEAALNAQIENHGAITADGGRVVMTAKAANSLVDTVINQNGIVKARGMTERNGEIILDGGENGTVKISGTLDASNIGWAEERSPSSTTNTNDGLPSSAHPMIQIKGNSIELNNTAIVNASGTQQGGTIQIGDKQHTQTVTLKQGSSVQADTDNGNAGHIDVLANMDKGQINVQGNLHAKAVTKGNGGFIDTSAHHVNIADSATINTQGKDGKNGTWLIDPFDFTIAATGGNITGSALSTALSTNSVTIQTLDTGTSCTGAVCTAGSAGLGDIFVNDVVGGATTPWTNNTLTLNAWRNIYINQNLNGSGAAKLELFYGQSSASGGTTDDYFIGNGAKVNLAAGQNFNTQKGTSGANLAYTVITDLGVETDASSGTNQTLQGMARTANLSGLYVLGADITNASDTSTWNSNAGFSSIGNSTTNFTGRFDGLGHTITGLYINRPTEVNVGLFGVSGSTSDIRNVGLLNDTITAQHNVGGLVGVNNGIVRNSYATGTVSANSNGFAGIGGLVGYNYGTITGSYTTGIVTGNGVSNSTFGGLVGLNQGNGAKVINSYSSATVSVTGDGTNLGGLVGALYYNPTVSISNSYSSGSVSSIGSNGSWLGGLVGAIYGGGSIIDSYTTSAVTNAGDSNVIGGLAGYSDGTITNTYASGLVSSTGTGNLVGGFVGQHPSGTFSNSFWDTQTTNQANAVGSGSVTGVISKTTSELLTQSTYTGWDFTNTWWMVEGSTRPFLRMEYSTNITNNHQLQLMAMNLGANYTLANNLDLTADLANPSSMWGTQSATVLTGITTGFSPVGNFSTRFTGKLDGLGHTITGLMINRPTTNYVGLFGFSSIGSSIQNIGLIGGNVVGQSYVGQLLGELQGGTLFNAYATGNVTGNSTSGNYIGGLVGDNDTLNTVSNIYATGNVVGYGHVGGLVGYSSSSISNAHATGTVTGTDRVGGLVGYITNATTLQDSYATGTVSGRNQVGGLVGYTANASGAVSGSYATGNVTGTGGLIGGLIGDNNGNISNSYATGTVQGVDQVGGLVGWNNVGNISNGYATGTVSGRNRVGGLVGYTVNASGAVSGSYATGNVTGTGDKVAGLIGDNNGNISNSYATGTVQGINQVGGLVGWNNVGTISSSHATGTVSGRTQVGGLVGYTVNALNVVSDSYATGNVTGTGGLIGGLIGDNNGNVSNSYATGIVQGVNYIGGLLGWHNVGTISTSHATGNVTGTTDYVGGLVGYISNAITLQDSYATGTVSGRSQVGGLVGASKGNISSSYATGTVSATGVRVGGLVGQSQSILNNVHSTGNVSATGNDGSGNTLVGGLVGASFSSISNAYATGKVTGSFNRVGGLVGNSQGTISDAYATGAVSGAWFVGGLVGINFSPINNTYATGGISAGYYGGGLVGYANGSQITNSYSTSNVDVTANGGNAGGGLIGYLNAGTVSKSYATGNVKATGSNNVFLGGLIGGSSSGTTVTDSYATGAVTNTGNNNKVGGLVGSTAGTFTNTYATGLVSNTGTGNTIGGLLGALITGGIVNNSFWDTQTTGQLSSAAGTGKTSAEMKQLATFSTWDISRTGGSSAIWRIYEGNTNPLLRNFMTALTLNDAPDLTNSYNGTTQTAGTTSTSNPLLLLGNAATGKNVGFYNGYYSIQQGYDITGGNLQITPASLTIKADDITKTYGETATLTYTPTGLQNGETIGSITLDSTGVAATAGVIGSPYTITASNATGGTFDANNYIINYLDGVLTITPAPLKYSANLVSRLYGTTNPTFTGSMTGLVNNDSLSEVVQGQAIFSSTATPSNLVGRYAITGTGLTLLSKNYILIQDANNHNALTINPVSLTITANNQTKTFGQTFNFNGTEFTNNGLVNGETIGNVILNSLGSAANASVNGSPYDIVANNATGGSFNPNNYSIIYINGKLTVNPLPVVIPTTPVIIIPNKPNTPVINTVNNSREPNIIPIKLIIRDYNFGLDQVVPLKVSITDIKHHHNLRWFYKHWLHNMFAKTRYGWFFNNLNQHLTSLIANSHVEIVNSGMKLPK